MAHIIDRKTDERDFGIWPVREHTSVTLTLLETAPGRFAAMCEATYRGVRNGRIARGPVPAHGNDSWVASSDPRVTVAVSNWSDNRTDRLVSGRVTIVVDAPVLGPITVFDKTVGGKYGMNDPATTAAPIAETAKPG